MIKNLLNTQLREKRADLMLLLLRVSFGGMMLTHGYPKLQKVIAGDMSFGDPLGIGAGPSLVLAAFAEFFASIGLIFGFFTRINAFLLTFTMWVAAFVQHGDDPFGRMEKAVLYLIVFIVLTFLGGGKYSVDDRLY